MSESWDLDRPGRFTVGAIGEPGSRVFYFQAYADGAEISIKCEKEQALALAEHLGKLVEQLPDDGQGAPPASEALPPEQLHWPTGPISIGLDEANARLVVQFEELVAVEDEEQAVEALQQDPAHLRVHLDRAQVLGYLAQVQELAAGGREICRLCEQPIDPAGHACPRLN